MKHVTVTSCVLLFSLPLLKAQVADTAINNPANRIAAPAFTATTIDNEEIDLAKLRGKTVVFNMWFTGCVPCVEEMPRLNRIADKYKKENIVFLSVNWDGVEDTREFLAKHEFKFKVIPDRRDIIIKLYQGQFVALPKTYIIDPDGRLKKVFTSGNSVPDLEKYLEELTGKKG